MIGNYVRHPHFGIGKVIRVRPGSELVYFFKEDEGLHDGAIEPGACEDNHGWWFSPCEIKDMKTSPLGLLIEKRRESKKICIYVDYMPHGEETDKEWEISIN